MDFPLRIDFIPGVGSARLRISDAGGGTVGCLAGVSGYLKAIVYSDETQATALYEIEWPYKDPEFRLKTVKGDYLGSIKRTPRRSVWRAHYVIKAGDEPLLEVVEESPFVKVLDTLAEMIPFVGLFNGYFLNPTYAVVRADGTRVLRVKKERTLNETGFSIHQLAEISPPERELAVLALLMFVMRENTRG